VVLPLYSGGVRGGWCGGYIVAATPPDLPYKRGGERKSQPPLSNEEEKSTPPGLPLVRGGGRRRNLIDFDSIAVRLRKTK